MLLMSDEFETGATAADQDEVKPAVKVVMSPEAAAAAAAAAQDAEAAADDDEDITVEVRSNEISMLNYFLKHDDRAVLWYYVLFYFTLLYLYCFCSQLQIKLVY